MGFVETKTIKHHFKPESGLFIGILIAGLLLRAYIVSITQTPGTSDPAFYYTVARNISEGRGLVIDYVAFYFNGLIPIPHYSNDYWLPLASILLSLPMFIFGKTVTSALVASVVAGFVPPLVGYFAALTFYKSKTFAIFAGILTYFSPIQITTSVVTDSIIFFGALGSAALFFSYRGCRNSRYFLIAAICSGLANMIRQDGILLLVTLLLMVLITQKTIREKALLAAEIIGIHFLVLSPLLIRGFVETHSIFSSGLSKTLFLTNYEDMYSYGKSFNWQTYRAALGIKKIIDIKFKTAAFNITQFVNFLDPLLAILGLIGLADLIRLNKWSEIGFLSPALMFVGLGYLSYSFLWSIHGPGSFYKSLAVLMPFIAIMVVSLLSRYIASTKVLAVTVIILTAYLGYQGFRQSYQFSTAYNQIYQYYDQAQTLVVQDATQRNIQPQDIVIMSREPWDVNAATRLKSIMIPNNDINTIVFVAQHYNAHYILLPGQRPQLDKIYNNTTPDPHFIYIASVPNSDMKIFWINFNP